MLAIERLRPTWSLTRPGSGFSEFDELVSRFFDEPFFNSAAAKAWAPSCDLVETDDQIKVLLDLPGMTKDNLDIQLNDSTLVVRGERKFEEQEKAKHHRLERFYGNFTRSFLLPANVEADKITATFKDGVLEVVLPKAESARTRRIQIKS